MFGIFLYHTRGSLPGLKSHLKNGHVSPSVTGIPRSSQIPFGLRILKLSSAKFNSSPLKNYHPKRRGLFSNRHFSGEDSLFSTWGCRNIFFVLQPMEKTQHPNNRKNPEFFEASKGAEANPILKSILAFDKFLGFLMLAWGGWGPLLGGSSQFLSG